MPLLPAAHWQGWHGRPSCRPGPARPGPMARRQAQHSPVHIGRPPRPALPVRPDSCWFAGRTRKNRRLDDETCAARPGGGRRQGASGWEVKRKGVWALRICRGHTGSLRARRRYRHYRESIPLWREGGTVASHEQGLAGTQPAEPSRHAGGLGGWPAGAGRGRGAANLQSEVTVPAGSDFRRPEPSVGSAGGGHGPGRGRVWPLAPRHASGLTRWSCEL